VSPVSTASFSTAPRTIGAQITLPSSSNANGLPDWAADNWRHLLRAVSREHDAHRPRCSAPRAARRTTCSGCLLMPSFTTSSTLTVVAAVLCGLQGGLFYAFSTAVMLALARQPHPSGMAAMQTINVVVFNPWFGGAFSLAPVACALAMITALARWPAPEAPWVVAGGAIFLIGTLAVTALCNVPRNDALEVMPATAQGAAELWSRYLREWTFWNHVRSGPALVGAALLTIALVNT
jgi:uncharacterized membrane protein